MAIVSKKSEKSASANKSITKQKKSTKNQHKFQCSSINCEVSPRGFTRTQFIRHLKSVSTNVWVIWILNVIFHLLLRLKVVWNRFFNISGWFWVRIRRKTHKSNNSKSARWSFIWEIFIQTVSFVRVRPGPTGSGRVKTGLTRVRPGPDGSDRVRP